MKARDEKLLTEYAAREKARGGHRLTSEQSLKLLLGVIEEMLAHMGGADNVMARYAREWHATVKDINARTWGA